MRRLLAAASLVPVLALGACGDKGGRSVTDSLKPLDVVRLAGESTSEAGSAKMAMSITGAGVTMNADGVTALDQVKSALTMKMSIAGHEIELDMRMIDQVIYFKLPAEMNTTGKPWVSLDLEALSKQSGVDIASLQQFRSADPTSTLAYFKGVSEDVKEVGKEDVRGEPTTKYTATFDLAKAIGSVDDPKAKKALQDATAKLGVAQIPASVWIDDKGRMRKMVQTIDLSKVAGVDPGAGALVTTFELYDFGTDLDVEAPPADQVGDGAALLGGGAAG
jgi:hypothetical protein